jgi:hypothetical protein
MSGAWDRDLVLDLDAVSDWGATAFVTLLEPFLDLNSLVLVTARCGFNPASRGVDQAVALARRRGFVDIFGYTLGVESFRILVANREARGSA